MSAIEAIGMGKKAAAEIDAFLRDLTTAHESADVSQMPVARRQMCDEELLPKPRVAVPLLSMEKRLGSFAEVELGYSQKQAMAEAQRCLVCGPCSECLACVKACKAEAIVHEKQTTLTDLEIGAIIYADEPANAPDCLPQINNRTYHVPPEDSLMGSAAAAHIMSQLTLLRPSRPFQTFALLPDDPVRAGVFICECGHLISDIVDTDELGQHAMRWTDVIHAQVLPFSCTREAGEAIGQKVGQLDLNRIILGACACCSLDQVCYSCTFQRVRCKANLGVFKFRSGTPQPEGFLKAGHLPPPAVEFVNIREQCAFAHADNPKTATAKAGALLAAAVAKMRLISATSLEAVPMDRSVMILGGGSAARVCRELLLKQNTAAKHIEALPLRVHRADRRYSVMQNGQTWTADAVVLTPRNSFEAQRLNAAFGAEHYRPRCQLNWGGLETHRPGIFYCDPSVKGDSCGAAAAARVSAWLGRTAESPGLITAVVEPHRCRACKTCIETCEFGAPQLIGQEPERTSWIDPVICTGCGTCAANCPSGAIIAGYATDEQLEAMITAVLK
jgi:ferredoxin